MNVCAVVTVTMVMLSRDHWALFEVTGGIKASDVLSFVIPYAKCFKEFMNHDNFRELCNIRLLIYENFEDL
jgi:hypothetical protein